MPSWGHPNFRADKKTFAVYEIYHGRPCVAVKLPRPDGQVLLGDGRFFVTPYTGKHGWISLWVDEPVAWSLVRDLVLRSYREVATSTARGARRCRAPLPRQEAPGPSRCAPVTGQEGFRPGDQGLARSSKPPERRRSGCVSLPGLRVRPGTLAARGLPNVRAGTTRLTIQLGNGEFYGRTLVERSPRHLNPVRVRQRVHLRAHPPRPASVRPGSARDRALARASAPLTHFGWIEDRMLLLDTST